MTKHNENAIEVRMQELNDALSKAHADRVEFWNRTEFYRRAEEHCGGFREEFACFGGMRVVVGAAGKRGALLECPEALANRVWLVMRQWQEAEKQTLVEELKTAGSTPTEPGEERSVPPADGPTDGSIYGFLRRSEWR